MTRLCAGVGWEKGKVQRGWKTVRWLVTNVALAVSFTASDCVHARAPALHPSTRPDPTQRQPCQPAETAAFATLFWARRRQRSSPVIRHPLVTIRRTHLVIGRLSVCVVQSGVSGPHGGVLFRIWLARPGERKTRPQQIHCERVLRKKRRERGTMLCGIYPLAAS